MAGKGYNGAQTELAILNEKNRVLKNLFKTEVSLPIVNLTEDGLASLLDGERFTVKVQNILMHKAVRVIYAEDRSIVIKIKVDKKSPETTKLIVHNEYGAMTLDELSKKANDLNNEMMGSVLKGAGSVAKGLGKGVAKTVGGVVNAVGSTVEGDVVSGVGNVAKGAGAAVADISGAIGGLAKNGALSKKEQIKLAKDEMKAGKESGDAEKLFTGCIRLYLQRVPIVSFIAFITSFKAKSDWKAKEAAALPQAWEEILALLKSKAGVQ